MYDFVPLPAAIALWLISIITIGIGWGVDWHGPAAWLGLIIQLTAVILVAWALLTTLDWVTHQATERLREYGYARTWPIISTANAIKGLSGSQMEFIERLEPVTIEMIVNEASPVYTVRVVGGSVPFEAVDEFLQLSANMPGYLYPVREFHNWRWAQSITNLIVQNGWAEQAKGPVPAKLLKDLAWVSARFGVEIKQ